MIRVFYLPVEIVDNTDKVKGIENIHDAILECTSDPNIRKLIMDTTTDEDTNLKAVAIEVREPNVEEQAAFNQMKAEIAEITPPRNLAAEIDELKARIEKLEKRRETL